MKSGLSIWQNHLVLKNDRWLFRGFQKTMWSQQSTSSNLKPDKASRQMDKKFVKNQDSKKVPVGPKGQPSKRNNRKGENLHVHFCHKSQRHVLVLDSQLNRSAGTLHVKRWFMLLTVESLFNLHLL
ncbi:uncharacterized protein LOC118492247 [Helianthus annuus]|uniref:uncharacterized protein LOC118492247 n=1 Tax=Helianthus annuus TaxID=4232 RepID=UPI00165301B7|nr:uncharacterized protein LOC118492247 [Helianthus annuus]